MNRVSRTSGLGCTDSWICFVEPFSWGFHFLGSSFIYDSMTG